MGNLSRSETFHYYTRAVFVLDRQDYGKRCGHPTRVRSTTRFVRDPFANIVCVKTKRNSVPRRMPLVEGLPGSQPAARARLAYNCYNFPECSSFQLACAGKSC